MTQQLKKRHRRAAAWVGGGLFLGVAVSVGTAWVAGWQGIPIGAVPLAEPVVHSAASDRGSIAHWFNHDRVIVPDFQEFEGPIDRDAPGWTLITAHATPPNTRMSSMTTLGYGWPCRCLIAERTAYYKLAPRSMDDYLQDHQMHYAWRFREWFSDSRKDRLLPLLPYWPGLLANTAFWGMPIPLAVLGLGTLRRNRRARRGLCAACGYDLAGVSAEVCPECGCGR